MCITVFSFNPNSPKPLVLGFNRDEKYLRKSLAPDYHWNTNTFLAPLDIKEKGSWLGINIFGIVVCILNKELKAYNATQNSPSRGLLVTEILKCSSIEQAIKLMKNIDVTLYKPFNLLIFDSKTGVTVSNYTKLSKPKLNIREVKSGVHLLSKTYLDDVKLPRINKNISISKKLNFSDIESLIALMQSKYRETNSSMVQHMKEWGTVSTTIIQLSNNNIQLKYKATDMESFLDYEMRLKES